MSGIEMIRKTISYAVRYCVSEFFGRVVVSVVPKDETRKIATLAARAGGSIVGWMVGDKAVEYFDGKIDEFEKKLKENEKGDEKNAGQE